MASVVLFACSKTKTSETIVENRTPLTSSSVATTERLGDNEKVKLVRAEDNSYYGCSRGGCSGGETRTYTVEVANLAVNKKVIIRQQLANGQWEDLALTFITKTPIGTELWIGTFSQTIANSSNPIKPYGEKFAVKYEVNGQTYWDNNANVNYTFNGGLNTSSVVLGSNLNILQKTAYSISALNAGKSGVTIYATLRNIAFVKDVKVVYTTNNWATNATASLFFFANASPNNAYEDWNGVFEVPRGATVKYALVYKVNGVEYWDNNYGANYTIIANN